MIIKNLLFDFDGTIVDSFPGIVRSFQFVLERMGREVPAAEALRWLVGPPLRKNLRHLLETEDEVVIEEGVRLYRSRYQSLGIFEASVYEGVEESLLTLRDGGVRLFIATSKPKIFAEKLLDHFRLAHLFERTYGTLLEGEPMSKRGLVEMALSENNLERRESAIIGDRHHDIDAGKEVGIKTIGVQWGYGTPEELTAAQPDYLLQSPSEVTALILQPSEGE